VSFDLALPPGGRTLAQPLNFAGSLTYRGEKLALNGKVDNLAALLDGKPTGAHVRLAAAIANADFSGTMGGGGIEGELKLGARSLRRLAAWAGKPLPPGNGFGLIALESGVAVKDGVVSLASAHAAFDSMSLNGDLAFDTASAIPSIKGSVTVDRLDINPYLAPGENEDTEKAARTAKATPDAALALDALKTFDADLTLTTGGLVTPDFKLDHATLLVALHAGRLKADMNALSLYGGTGTGRFTADLTGPVPTFRETLKLIGIKAQPFLENFAGVKRISGTGAVTLDLAAQGATPGAIVRALSGTGEIHLTDGTVSGVDLAAVARIVQSVLAAQPPANIVGDRASTPFGALGGTFTIANGVLRTDDLTLTHPAMRMSGRGSVDLANRTLEFHFRPTPARKLPGFALADIGIPFYVKGLWSKPAVGPDARDLAKTLVERFKGKNGNPLDALTQPGLSLKSLLGIGKKPQN
jgi:AsmA protein